MRYIKEREKYLFKIQYFPKSFLSKFDFNNTTFYEKKIEFLAL